MSKLTLTRRVGQCTRLELINGVFVHLILAYVGSNQVKLELTGPNGLSASKRVDVGSHWEICPGVIVNVTAINFRNVKLTFDAPLNVKIVRTEVLERAQ